MKATLAALLIAAAPAAFADTNVQVEFEFDRAELATEEGRTAVEQRIQEAAERACDPQVSFTNLRLLNETEACEVELAEQLTEALAQDETSSNEG